MSTSLNEANIPAEARKLRGAEPTPETGRAAATIQVLQETAERLFAEKGVDHVSLRQIVLESGQKNLAALHYHFGSRAALVTEVLRTRRIYVNSQRNRYLDEMLARGGNHDLRDVVAVSLRALSHAIRDTEWGRRYISVLAQTTLSPQLRADGIALSEADALLRVHALIRELLSDIEPEVVEQRLIWFTHLIIYSMAHWCQLHPIMDHDAFAEHTEQLIDFCVGGLLGSASGRT